MTGRIGILIVVGAVSGVVVALALLGVLWLLDIEAPSAIVGAVAGAVAGTVVPIAARRR